MSVAEATRYVQSQDQESCVIAWNEIKLIYCTSITRRIIFPHFCVFELHFLQCSLVVAAR